MRSRSIKSVELAAVVRLGQNGTVSSCSLVSSDPDLQPLVPTDCLLISRLLS